MQRRNVTIRNPDPSTGAGLSLIVISAITVASCGDPVPGLSTAEISSRAKAVVRQELGLSENAALFTDIFVPGYESGELMACGSVSGTRADGEAIAPRRFIVQLEPARWVRWGTRGSADFARSWADICLHPDERSQVPFLPE